jgi:hypothetical protein
MKDVVGGLVFGTLLVFAFLGVIQFRTPDEDDVILGLVQIGAVKEELIDHEIRHTIVDERIRPLLEKYVGYGISLNGNVISH